ncbi:MAG: carbon storage regulator [Planctomycetaceae bacterium]
MLVLTRAVGEELVIAGNIRVRVAEVKGGRIRLAVEAPREVTIRRQELPASSPLAEPVGANT